MSTNNTKPPSAVDEETLREDEIDELSDDLGDDLTDESPDAGEAQLQIADLTVRLQEAENARLRALADYQNLQRRSQADRANWSKLATQDVMASLLVPLEHLLMASQQLRDPGLAMVVTQLFDQLAEHGLKKIDVLGKSFNAETMEAIAGSNPTGKKVSAVMQNGYTLNGVLIQPAKVTIE